MLSLGMSETVEPVTEAVVKAVMEDATEAFIEGATEAVEFSVVLVINIAIVVSEGRKSSQLKDCQKVMF